MQSRHKGKRHEGDTYTALLVTTINFFRPDHLIYSTGAGTNTDHMVVTGSTCQGFTLLNSIIASDNRTVADCHRLRRKPNALVDNDMDGFLMQISCIDMLSFCNEAGISRMTTQNDSSFVMLLKSVYPSCMFLVAPPWFVFNVAFVVCIAWSSLQR